MASSQPHVWRLDCVDGRQTWAWVPATAAEAREQQALSDEYNHDENPVRPNRLSSRVYPFADTPAHTCHVLCYSLPLTTVSLPARFMSMILLALARTRTAKTSCFGARSSRAPSSARCRASRPPRSPPRRGACTRPTTPPRRERTPRRSRARTSSRRCRHARAISRTPFCLNLGTHARVGEINLPQILPGLGIFHNINFQCYSVKS